MSIAIGLLAGLIAGVAAAGLSALRIKNWGVAVSLNFAADFLLIFLEDGAIHTRPSMTFAGLMPLIFFNIATIMIVAWVADGCALSVGLLSPVATVAMVIAGIVYLHGYSSGHGQHVACPPPSTSKTCIKEAVGLVPVDEAPGGTLPASTTSNLVVVTGDEAETKASIAMSSGLAATRNFSTYLNLGPATLQMVDSTMYYVFQLEFDGAINKHRLGGIEPGYIMVSAQDPNQPAIERYASKQHPDYSMKVSLGGGQGSEPDRWARSHGYEQYLLDDPTLEIADNGDPYFTVTLLSPQVGWTFQAPAGVLLINAHTGAITQYSLPGRGLKNPAPAWADRIYSQDMASEIASWYGNYRYAPFGGRGNSNRFQVSADPVMVYTGDGNPSWRMLLTSYGNERSVYKIIEMDAASGAMDVYTPSEPMGVESSVASAMCGANGVGAGNIKSNHLVPEDLTLHVIDGQLTWMASYESAPATGTADDGTADEAGDVPDPCGDNSPGPSPNPTFNGIGFVSAYNVSANNVAYGTTRASALANYEQQLISQPNAQGNTPGAGSQYTTVTGTICAKAADISGGTETYYLNLCGKNGKTDWSATYAGSTSALSGPAVAQAQTGDRVIIQVQKTTAGQAPSLDMASFSDTSHGYYTAPEAPPASAPASTKSAVSRQNGRITAGVS